MGCKKRFHNQHDCGILNTNFQLSKKTLFHNPEMLNPYIILLLYKIDKFKSNTYIYSSVRHLRFYISCFLLKPHKNYSLSDNYLSGCSITIFYDIHAFLQTLHLRTADIVIRSSDMLLRSLYSTDAQCFLFCQIAY